MANNFKGNYNNQKRKKVTPVTYKKIVSDFDNALIELKEINSFIKDLFMDANNLEDAESDMINYIYDNKPNLFTKNNIHVSLSIGTNRAMLRTEEGFSFGWYISYTIEDGKAKETNVEITYTSFNESSMRDDLLDNGWNIEERRK